MDSIGDDEGKARRGGDSNSIIDSSDAQTQTFDTQSPSSSSSCGEESKDWNADEFRPYQSTMPFDDTIPLDVETQLLNLDDETQEIEDLDCDENVRTQLLDECEEEFCVDSDGEGTDRTEVLSASDDDCEKGVRNDPVGLEKGGKDFVVDCDASDDIEHSSGSVRRSFMSVRAASLRASGRAAARSMTKGTNNEETSIPSSIQSGKEHLQKDDGMAAIRVPTSVGTEVREVDQDHDTRNCHVNIEGFRDETKCKGGSSIVRKLFNEDICTGTNGSVNDNDSTNGLPELLACDHEFAGLSYLVSQEPGELSQANALDIVDRFLSVNDVELSQEVGAGKTVKRKSPPVSMAKGPQSLAKKAGHRSPVREVGIFDWVESLEDEGGGNFFSNRKEAFFGSRGHGRRSITQPRNPRHLNFSKSRGVVDKLGEEEEEGLNLHQKLTGLTRSESKLMLHESKDNDKIVQIFETSTRKNLFKELDEELNVESPEQQLEAAGVGRDSPDMYDVGFDTQMAAEAMQALVCGTPVNHDTDDSYQVTQNVTDGSSRGESKNRALSKHVSIRKRPFSSDSGDIARQSKRTNILDTKLSNEIPISSRKYSKNPVSAFKMKANKGKSKAEQHLKNGNENLGRRSSKSVQRRKTVGAVETTHIKEVDKYHSLSTSNGNLSLSKDKLQEDYRTFSPIARRTRQSTAVNPLKGLNSFNYSEAGISDLMGVSIRGGKRTGSILVDAPKPLTVKGQSSKLGSNQSGEVSKKRPSQQEYPGLGGRHEETATTSYEKGDAMSYPRGRRTHRKMSGHLNNTGNLDGPSTIADVEEANGQSITKRKRSKINVRSTCPILEMKRKTRSSVYPHPFLSSLEKNSEGSLIRQNVVEPCSVDAAGNCSSAGIVEKMIYKDLGRTKSSMHSGRKIDADSLSTAVGAEGNVRLEVSLRENVKSSGSACVTPINCITPINVASPICVGDDYHKWSCKKRLSRSSLTRELIRLDSTEAAPTLVLKDLRKRRDMANIRVLFSNHLDDDIIKQQKKISARLGVSIASSSSEATHFVTDTFARTRNMLEAIALGKPVVTHLWLESCGQASCFIDEKKYIMRDTKKEKEIGFSMPVSLARACQSPLLQGKRIFITPNIKPSRELIASLVKAVRGQAVERIGRSAMKDDQIPDDLMILSCEEDYAICVPLLEKGATVYSSEFLLNGIVIQKLEYERHRLFTDHIKRTRSTIWLRKEDDTKFHPVSKRK